MEKVYHTLRQISITISGAQEILREIPLVDTQTRELAEKLNNELEKIIELVSELDEAISEEAGRLLARSGFLDEKIRELERLLRNSGLEGKRQEVKSLLEELQKDVQVLTSLSEGLGRIQFMLSELKALTHKIGAGVEKAQKTNTAIQATLEKINQNLNFMVVGFGVVAFLLLAILLVLKGVI